jgi:hypothetical protein
MEEENRRAGTSVIRPFGECHVAAAAVKKIFGGRLSYQSVETVTQLTGFPEGFYFLLLPNDFRHAGQGFERPDNLTGFIPQYRTILDDIYGAAVTVLVGDQTPFGVDIAGGMQRAPFFDDTPSDDAATGAVQDPAGVAHQICGRITGQFFSSWIQQQDAVPRVNDDQTGKYKKFPTAAGFTVFAHTRAMISGWKLVKEDENRGPGTKEK